MHGAFLQTPEWEKINQSMGRRTWRVSGILVIRHDVLRRFNYLYCPRPNLGIQNQESRIKDFVSACKEIAKKEKSLFLKIDPAQDLGIEHSGLGICNAPSLQPQKTIIIDLSKPEDELRAAMHEKTRYNIGLSERKEIEVMQVIHRDAKEDFEVFWDLLTKTATRNGFHLHDKKYYELLSHVRTPRMSNELFFARASIANAVSNRAGIASAVSNRMSHDHDIVLAAAMVNFHHDPAAGVSTATYLHGASSDEHRELMAPHLLHWRIMQEAKRRGIGSYDVWGIDAERWPGITRFKTGFGGNVVVYPASTHIIYRPVWNMLYTLMKHRK